MNTSINVALQTAATVLLTLGVTSIHTNWLEGLAEIVIGAALYLVYELTPQK